MLTLNVKRKYFDMIKSSKKTIELRLYDEKRRQIKVGDTIEFRCAEDVNEHFLAEVVQLYLAEDFARLCQKIDCQKAGFSSDEALINALEEFYDIVKQKAFGVVGIEVRKL